eukprot:8278266-Pyramimonas_sp.AAC.1
MGDVHAFIDRAWVEANGEATSLRASVGRGLWRPQRDLPLLTLQLDAEWHDHVRASAPSWSRSLSAARHRTGRRQHRTAPRAPAR